MSFSGIRNSEILIINKFRSRISLTRITANLKSRQKRKGQKTFFTQCTVGNAIMTDSLQIFFVSFKRMFIEKK